MKFANLAAGAVLLALVAFCAFASQLVFAEKAVADDSGSKISLPAPDKTGGIPLMQALDKRHSSREFKSDPLPPQELSNLLWATFGVNREDGKRTAPTARDSKAVYVYVAMESGVYSYDAVNNELGKVLALDARGKFGGAPVTLIYVAPESDSSGPLHVGSLYQNAGLYCASAGLANTVKLTGIDALKGQLPLAKGMKVFIVHPIGYPK